MRSLRRFRLQISGVVQGVGFRPFVYRLARELGVAGYVANSGGEVEVEAAGPAVSLRRLMTGILQRSPSMAHITRIRVKELPFSGGEGFRILASRSDFSGAVWIPPDSAVCDECLAELYDPTDRRFRYPFINCTNCGPRYTLIRGLPYDRPLTTMASFTMCPECWKEYTDPSHRRFHAEPNACPACGPSLSLQDARGRQVLSEDPIRAAARLLEKGCILAVKGVGGFHLAVDAGRDEAVEALRRRKHRPSKPFAVMARSIAMVETIARVNDLERSLLSSPQRPIVLLTKAREFPLSEFVAPQNRRVGVMLPYTPLHYLLLDAVARPLVMTSGNPVQQPIVKGNEEALRQLSGVADYFLVHNRDIHVRADDSVLHVAGGRPRMLRRSRGYAPLPLSLHGRAEDTLAVGGELKNTVCLTRKDRAFVSQHIGDVTNWETFEVFKATIEHLRALLGIRPRLLAHDLHPDYPTTAYALEVEAEFERRIGVQHHHAHAVACMGEYGLSGPVIGVVMDGTGYGLDGCIWGGEVLVVRAESFERWGHLAYHRLPGGDQAAREPWRMAVSLLYDAFGEGMFDFPLDFWKRIDRERAMLLVRMISREVQSPLTSSCGRLFDAVSAFLGIRHRVSYEGQAAVELEAAADFSHTGEYPIRIVRREGEAVLDTGDLFRNLVRDRMAGTSPGTVAARFHRSLVSGWLAMCRQVREERGLNRVVLSGGAFQNRFLLDMCLERLGEAGFEAFAPEKLPVNDGGIAFGQAVIAHAVSRTEVGGG